MASIDKTYVNLEQYLQVRQFWIDTREQQLKELGHLQWLYSFDQFKNVKFEDIDESFLLTNTDDINIFKNLKDGDDFPVWNTSSVFDLWLAKNCKLDFIQDRLKIQYGKNWIGHKFIDKVDFSLPPVIMHISHNDSNIYFFKPTKNKDEVETLDKMLVYGTTDFFKLYHNAKEQIQGYVYNLENLKILFEYYGVLIEFKNNKFYHDKKIIDIGYVSNFDNWKLPKIKYSFNKNDVKKYHNEEIYFSTDTDIFPLTDYIEHDKSRIC